MSSKSLDGVLTKKANQKETYTKKTPKDSVDLSNL